MTQKNKPDQKYYGLKIVETGKLGHTVAGISRPGVFKSLKSAQDAAAEWNNTANAMNAQLEKFLKDPNPHPISVNWYEVNGTDKYETYEVWEMEPNWIRKVEPDNK